MDDMTVGMCLEFIDEYLYSQDPEQFEPEVITATQVHFDNF